MQLAALKANMFKGTVLPTLAEPSRPLLVIPVASLLVVLWVGLCLMDLISAQTKEKAKHLKVWYTTGCA